MEKIFFTHHTKRVYRLECGIPIVSVSDFISACVSRFTRKLGTSGQPPFCRSVAVNVSAHLSHLESLLDHIAGPHPQSFCRSEVRPENHLRPENYLNKYPGGADAALGTTADH